MEFQQQVRWLLGRFFRGRTQARTGHGRRIQEFIATEAVAAGVLWLIGLLSPWMLIISGVATLLGLVAFDHGEAISPGRIGRFIKWGGPPSLVCVVALIAGVFAWSEGKINFHGAVAAAGPTFALYADCVFEPFPNGVPESGDIQVLAPQPLRGGVFNESGFNSPWHHPDPALYRIWPALVPFIYTCELTNDAATPLLDVKFTLILGFFEAVKDQKKHSETVGRMTLRLEHPISIPRIDPGRQNSFVFWIWNVNKEWLGVHIPTNATAQSLSSGRRDGVIRTRNAELELPPSPLALPVIHPGGSLSPLSPTGIGPKKRR